MAKPIDLKNVRGYGPAAMKSLDEDIARVGDDLRTAIRELVEPLTGTSPRPGDVVDVLGIDKTQAWRIVRVLEHTNPYEVLYESASPKGLATVIHAAERAGAGPDEVETATAAVTDYEKLIKSFPDGSAGLHAALATHVPRASETLYRDARRKIVQGMSQVLGVRAATRYMASIIVPSGDDASADVVAIAGYLDYRRLRPGVHPIVFSGRHYAPVPGGDPPRLLTLDGDADSDPYKRYLADFSSLPPDDLRMLRQDRSVRLILHGDHPGVNEPVDMFFGQRLAGVLRTTRIDDRKHEIINSMLKSPSDVAIFDTLVHESLYPSSDPPRMTVERSDFNPAVQSKDVADDAFRVDQPMTTASLGKGLRRITSREVPTLPDVLNTTFARIGHDPAEFRVYRTRQVFPLPGFSIVTWLDLPEPE